MGERDSHACCADISAAQPSHACTGVFSLDRPSSNPRPVIVPPIHSVQACSKSRYRGEAPYELLPRNEQPLKPNCILQPSFIMSCGVMASTKLGLSQQNAHLAATTSAFEGASPDGTSSACARSSPKSPTRLIATIESMWWRRLARGGMQRRCLEPEGAQDRIALEHPSARSPG